MNDMWIVTLAFWPAVVLVCALINMRVSGTFSWSELIFDYLIGVVAGAFLFYGTRAHPSTVTSFFLFFSHGLFGLLWWLSSGFRHLFHTPTAFLWFMAALRLGATLWAALLDRGSVALGASLSPGPFFFSLLVAPAKLCFSWVTGAVGLLIWLAAVIAAIAGGGRAGFAGGVFFSEFSPGPDGFYATTVGFTVQCWNGNVPFRHELYHTRQHIYMSDWLIPFWLLGTLWGAVSALASGRAVSTDLTYGADASAEIGNPLEIGAKHQTP